MSALALQRWPSGPVTAHACARWSGPYLIGGRRLNLRAELDPDTLMAWVEERVAPYERIRQVEIVEEIPRSPTGKLLRRVLRARV